MENGSTLYLIRENATKMEGCCFIDNDRAVVEKISFFADATGATTFIYGSDPYSGKMTVNSESMEIELFLAQMPTLALEAETVRLHCFGKVAEPVDCREYYKNPIFEYSGVAKEKKYGEARGYYISMPSDHIAKDDYKKWFSEMRKAYWDYVAVQGLKQLPLKLDIYHPENHNSTPSPVVLLIHGGAFFFGDKKNQLQQLLTEYLVKRGYIVASINYRLGSTLTGTGAIKRTIYRGVQDTRAALRFLVHHKEALGIDEDQIYIAGSSAGGIIALTTAFMDSNEVYSSTGGRILREDLGGLDDSGNTYKNSFKVAGVVSFWGAVTDLKMLDNHIPTLLFHGTQDNIVPSGEGLPFKDKMGDPLHEFLSSFGKLYGSDSIFNRLNYLNNLNIPVRYVQFKDYGHDAYIESDETLSINMDIIYDELSNFLYYNVSKHYFNHNLSGNTTVTKHDPAPIYTLDNLGNDAIVQWDVDGGFITHQTNNNIRVIWYNSYETGTVTACITNKNNISGKKEMMVKIK